MVKPLKKRYCQGTERASSINLTTKAPKDQKIPAIKTINIAKLVLSLGINYFISKSVILLKSVITPLSRIDNLNLVGLNYKDKTKNAQKFLEDIGNPFDIILSDTDGTKSIFLGAYGVPETLILDSELKILKKYIGPIDSNIVGEIKNLAN